MRRLLLVVIVVMVFSVAKKHFLHQTQNDCEVRCEHYV